MTKRIPITYVTSSLHKREEIGAVATSVRLADGRLVGEVFEFDFRSVQIKELLEVDIEAMVQAEVLDAYCQLKVPCIVEHAGLIFDDYRTEGYPGGLTKPMWNTLRDRFVDETRSAGRRAIARAVVAYCDGHQVRTFRGDVEGTIATAPAGNRQFYWDTVFVPAASQPGQLPQTYAEIAADPARGLDAKVAISQSTKAMLAFLEYRLHCPTPSLWEGIGP